ncbi:MAG: hypothetical protein ACK40E_02125 [Caldimicrobium sp.]
MSLISLKRLILFLLFLLFYTGCAPKEYSLIDIYSYIMENGISKRALSGKVFIEGETFFLNNFNKSGGAYGNFYLNNEQFLIIYRPPLASEFYLYWEKGQRGLKFIDPNKKKVYFLKLPEGVAEKIPLYFLGLRETNLSLQKNSLKGVYKFDREYLSGEFSTNLFKLNWKIKELSFYEKPFPSFDWSTFKEKKVELFF